MIHDKSCSASLHFPFIHSCFSLFSSYWRQLHLLLLCVSCLCDYLSHPDRFTLSCVFSVCSLQSVPVRLCTQLSSGPAIILCLVFSNLRSLLEVIFLVFSTTSLPNLFFQDMSETCYWVHLLVVAPVTIQTLHVSVQVVLCTLKNVAAQMNSCWMFHNKDTLINTAGCSASHPVVTWVCFLILIQMKQ